MKNNFDLRKFLVENKLTTNSRLANELSDTMEFDGVPGYHVGDAGDYSVYSLEDSSTQDTCWYGIVDNFGTKDVITVDVAGEQQSPEDIIQLGASPELAAFIADDINKDLEY